MIKEEKLIYLYHWTRQRASSIEEAKKLIYKWDRGDIVMPYFNNMSRESMAYQVGMALDNQIPEKINGNYKKTKYGQILYWAIS